MKKKVERTLDELIGIVSNWEHVQAVAVAEFLSDEEYDPYFFISLDVYHEHDLPSFEERKEQFPRAIAFESSRAKKKDRFLINDLPVRLEYKNTKRVEARISSFADYEDLFRYSGTYGLYRLQHGFVRYDPEGWIQSVKEKMKESLKRIESGEFAKDWLAENAAGKPNLLKKREELGDHPIEIVGRKIRALFEKK